MNWMYVIEILCVVRVLAKSEKRKKKKLKIVQLATVEHRWHCFPNTRVHMLVSKAAQRGHLKIIYLWQTRRIRRTRLLPVYACALNFQLPIFSFNRSHNHRWVDNTRRHAHLLTHAIPSKLTKFSISHDKRHWTARYPIFQRCKYSFYCIFTFIARPE